jgi:hypothetical protein
LAAFVMSTPARFQFGLSSMLLITTLVAVIMSVSLMVPGIGIALAMASVPALLRTYVLVRRKRESGDRVTNHDKALLFVLCLGIALTIAIATGAAFFVPCFVSTLAGAAISNSSNGIAIGGMIGVIAGLIAALTVLVYLLRKWFNYQPVAPNTAELLHAWMDHPDDASGGISTPAKPSQSKLPASGPTGPPTELPGETTR